MSAKARAASKGRNGESSDDTYTAPANPKDWKFTQWFKKMPTEGNDEDSDNLTTVSFDPTGKYLATGDKGGRIVVLESDGSFPSEGGQPHFRFHCEFQSHLAEFDYVRSMNVDEKIHQITWGPASNDALYLYSTNDRSIKLWKIHEKKSYVVEEWNLPGLMEQAAQDETTGAAKGAPGPMQKLTPSEQAKREASHPGLGLNSLRIPRLEAMESVVTAELKTKFPVDANQFPINTLQTMADDESVMAADNLRINLWNMNHPQQAFNVVDIKPVDMADLREVITAASVNPQKANEFVYCTSGGITNLCDLRTSARCDQVISYSPHGQQEGQANFFAEVTQSISHCRYLPHGRSVVTRDFMTLKVWDLANTSQPAEVIYIHEQLRPKLWDLYGNERVYDMFEVATGPSSNTVVTGSYSNLFHIYDLSARTDTWIEASKVPVAFLPMRTDKNFSDSIHGLGTPEKKRSSRKIFGRGKNSKQKKKPENMNGFTSPQGEYENMDYDLAVLQCVYHPTEELIAVASDNNLYLYSE